MASNRLAPELGARVLPQVVDVAEAGLVRLASRIPTRTGFHAGADLATLIFPCFLIYNNKI